MKKSFILFLLLFKVYCAVCQTTLIQNDSFLINKKDSFLKTIDFDINLNLFFQNGRYKAIRNGSSMEGNISNNRKIDTWKTYYAPEKRHTTEVYSNDSVISYYQIKDSLFFTVKYGNKNELFRILINGKTIYDEYYIDSLDLFHFREYYANFKLKKTHSLRQNHLYGNYIEYHSNGGKRKEACYCEVLYCFNDENNWFNNTLCREKLGIHQSLDNRFNTSGLFGHERRMYLPVLFNSWDKNGNPITIWKKEGNKVIYKEYKNGKIIKELIYQYNETTGNVERL